MDDFSPELVNELKSFYVERWVDNMETKDLVQYVTDDLDRYFENVPDVEFIAQAREYWEDHFDEVVEEIKDYMKCDFKTPLRQSTTYSLKVGETISFPVHNPDS
tara:strand:+ start:6105 stop:6416 length:312 start_codon:yes stop_codon:yes gene_type:complete